MHLSSKWEGTDCWISTFDILGFKALANIENGTFQAQRVQEDYEETLTYLEKSCSVYAPGDLDYLWLSDTFVLFTLDDSGKSYTIIQQASKRFFEKCLYSEIPIRGAISVGPFIRSLDHRAVMGKAFIDSFTHGEDQDWLGLILTPAAIDRVRSYGLNPAGHDFVSYHRIPMRKYSPESVMAYRLQNGSANFSSPFITHLQQMKRRAGNKHHEKYDRTLEFIGQYYRYNSS